MRQIQLLALLRTRNACSKSSMRPIRNIMGVSFWEPFSTKTSCKFPSTYLKNPLVHLHPAPGCNSRDTCLCFPKTWLVDPDMKRRSRFYAKARKTTSLPPRSPKHINCRGSYLENRVSPSDCNAHALAGSCQSLRALCIVEKMCDTKVGFPSP